MGQDIGENKGKKKMVVVGKGITQNDINKILRKQQEKSGVDPFNINHVFKEYLRMVGLEWDKMIPSHQRETKRAFYAGFGGCLMMSKNDLSIQPDQVQLNLMKDMYNQVNYFWAEEEKKAGEVKK